MPNSDLALEALRRIRADFATFLATRGAPTEADTRAQLIDRILEEVLLWPKTAIDRETYVKKAGGKRGFIDYGLRLGASTYLLLEAKKEGVYFDLPNDFSVRKPPLNGPLSSDTEIWNAISQVRGYCDEEGIRFAIVTNGYAWIVFRAVRDDNVAWKKGHALIFPSLDVMEENFTEFWNTLSFQAIQSGSLSELLGKQQRTSRELFRVSTKLFNATLPLAKNRLHGQLGPIIKTFFDDIGDLEQLKVLEQCYVYGASLGSAAEDLNSLIADTVPKLLREHGTTDLRQTKLGTGQWQADLERALGARKGELFLLLGGIGCGKTTFLRRYQRTVGSKLLNENTYWFHVSFLGPPLDPTQIEQYICKTIRGQIETRYKEHGLESRKAIKRAYSGEIASLNETALGGVNRNTNEYEAALSPHLASWQQNLTDYVPKLLAATRDAKDKAIVLFIDNVDQLQPAYQQQIFIAAQGLTRQIGCVTVIALREESYYAPNTQKTFSAYATRKFHIASPRFRRLIGSRIKLALETLEAKSQITIPTTISLDQTSIVDFLKIVELSIFDHNKNIARMIEALCFGNMRKALEWFSMFLTSGATDVDKMLSIYRRDGAYHVAYHEFVKSIMLSERRYYSENNSPIMNVFDVGSERNSSHFTSLRILDNLLKQKEADNPEGRGYVEVHLVASIFEEVFDNREDFVRSCNRLLSRQLIEVNTRSTETIENASHFRATSAGWYYTKYFSRSFPYLDLVLQDTPINDAGIERSLRESVFQVDNMGDKEHDKMMRLEARFGRVEVFLDYLAAEEAEEVRVLGLKSRSDLLGYEWMPEIRTEYARQRDLIRKRVKENRERFAEEIGWRESADDERIFIPDDALDGAGAAESNGVEPQS